MPSSQSFVLSSRPPLVISASHSPPHLYLQNSGLLASPKCLNRVDPVHKEILRPPLLEYTPKLATLTTSVVILLVQLLLSCLDY